MHPNTFDYIQPTPKQIEAMGRARAAAKTYAEILNAMVPDSPDKTYIMRSLRSLAMWVNIAITRLPDGTPREDDNTP